MKPHLKVLNITNAEFQNLPLCKTPPAPIEVGKRWKQRRFGTNDDVRVYEVCEYQVHPTDSKRFTIVTYTPRIT